MESPARHGEKDQEFLGICLEHGEYYHYELKNVALLKICDFCNEVIT